MSGRRRISDEDLSRLRGLWAEGCSAPDLAAEFGVTARHVRRLVNEEQRPTIGDADELDGGVLAAVDAFLIATRLRSREEVLAATARALASKLDACSASDSAAAAHAVPRLASQLIDVLAQLREAAPREPDRVEQIRLRREARLRGVNTNGNGTVTTERNDP